MGIIIDMDQINTQDTYYRLVIYANKNHIIQQEALSINQKMANELIKFRPRQRTMYVEQCLKKIISDFPQNSLIKDFDVLFNPAYKIDVVKVLINVNKQYPFMAVWPGYYDNGRLIYGEENFLDYKTYSVNDYDILCVI